MFVQLLQLGSTIAQHLQDFFRIGSVPGSLINAFLSTFFK